MQVKRLDEQQIAALVRGGSVQNLLHDALREWYERTGIPTKPAEIRLHERIYDYFVLECFANVYFNTGKTELTGKQVNEFCGIPLKKAYIPDDHIQLMETVCPGCKNEIDPELCWCGDAIGRHSYHDGHSPVPMGCDCGRIKSPPNETTTETPVSPDLGEILSPPKIP
jgi:hypothetical protein